MFKEGFAASFNEFLRSDIFWGVGGGMSAALAVLTAVLLTRRIVNRAWQPTQKYLNECLTRLIEQDEQISNLEKESAGRSVSGSLNPAEKVRKLVFDALESDISKWHIFHPEILQYNPTSEGFSKKGFVEFVTSMLFDRSRKQANWTHFSCPEEKVSFAVEVLPNDPGDASFISQVCCWVNGNGVTGVFNQQEVARLKELCAKLYTAKKVAIWNARLAAIVDCADVTEAFLAANYSGRPPVAPESKETPERGANPVSERGLTTADAGWGGVIYGLLKEAFQRPGDFSIHSGLTTARANRMQSYNGLSFLVHAPDRAEVWCGQLDCMLFLTTEQQSEIGRMCYGILAGCKHRDNLIKSSIEHLTRKT